MTTGVERASIQVTHASDDVDVARIGEAFAKQAA